ncbi:MAG TPA: c-type cytochrome [Thermoanaerobaculia bacterium]
MTSRTVVPSALIVLLSFSCAHTRDVPLPALTAAAGDTSVARGEYIVRNVAVCGGCHAANPKQDIDGPLSGGMEFRSWRIGVARASNLTPDADTGLGPWTEAEIVRALRNGVRKDGGLLAPVMPYDWLHEMSDADALAVARYLKSLPPVRNAVRQEPSIAFKLGKLFLLRPVEGTTASAPARAATAEYGGYLAEHVGLCGECHTPRAGLQEKSDKSRLFAGAIVADFPANPSNLTPDMTTGIGKWSEADFIKTIRTGVNPAGLKVHPFMPWQENRRMTDDDLSAIYRFLRTLPAIQHDIPRKQAATPSP